MERWYRDFRIDSRQQDWPALSSRLLHGLHACMSNMAGELGANPLALGFPGWNSQGVGNLFRLVSHHPAALEQIEYEPVIARLLESMAVELSPLAPVPEARVFAEFSYRRDRQPEKRFTGFTARQNRRRERRGQEVRDPARRSSRQPDHYIRLHSSESGHGYCLFLRRSALEREAGQQPININRYGLSTADSPSAIPHFS